MDSIRPDGGTRLPRAKRAYRRASLCYGTVPLPHWEGTQSSVGLQLKQDKDLKQDCCAGMRFQQRLMKLQLGHCVVIWARLLLSSGDAVEALKLLEEDVQPSLDGPEFAGMVSLWMYSHMYH